MKSSSLWPFVSSFFHLAYCFQGSWILYHSFHGWIIFHYILHTIYLSVYRCTFGWFPFLAIVKSAAMNIHVQVFVWKSVFNFLGYISSNGIAGVCGKTLTFWGLVTLFSKLAAVDIVSSNGGGFQFLHILANTYFPFFFEIISHCAFNLHSAND